MHRPVLRPKRHVHRRPLRPASLAACAAADVAVVLLFVAVGRFSHGEQITAGGLFGTLWPFAVGVAGGYVGVVFTRWHPLSVSGGLMVGVKTVILGLLLRAGVQGDPTPFAFVVTTTVLIVGLTLGWRLLARTAEPEPTRWDRITRALRRT